MDLQRFKGRGLKHHSPWSEIFSDEGLLSMLIPMSSTLLGNLHLNFTTPEHSEDVLSAIEPYVFEWTGLFSAN